MIKKSVPYHVYEKRGEIIDRLQRENECLQNARRAMKWIKTDTARKAPEQMTVELLAAYITKLEVSLTTPAKD